MKLYLSSLSVMLLAVFAASAPALCAGTQGNSAVIPVPQGAPMAGKSERDVAAQSPDYFTIDPDSIKISLKETKEEPGTGYVGMKAGQAKDLGAILVSIDSIINIATKVWDIVQANAPVTDIDTKYATAYPQGVTAATQLAQWSKPKSQVYGFSAKNLYGMTMIDCEYKVTYTYNGAFQGKGKFLTAVTVVPTKVTVGWGYKFYMTASVPDSTITNVGTDADPVAAMQLKLAWKMSTVLKEEDGASVYYVQGDGDFEEIANPWNAQSKLENIKSAAPLMDGASAF